MPVSKKQTYPKKDFTHTRGYKKRHPKQPIEKRGSRFDSRMDAYSQFSRVMDFKGLLKEAIEEIK